MIYLAVVNTLFLIFMIIFMIVNRPTVTEIEKSKKLQEDHNKYQKEVNEEVLELHKRMLEELYQIGDTLSMLSNKM